MTIDKKLVKELAELLKDNDLTEIEYDTKQFSIKVVRGGTSVVQTVAAATPMAPSAPTATLADTTVTASVTADLSNAVRAPMVGVLYHAAETGAAPYIKEGDTIKKGQTLFLIEAMKTFNPVKADRAGKVVKILVGNGKPVEFDEPLVIVE